MLKSVRRWLFGPPALPGWVALQVWCAERQLLLRPTRERDGFVIERPGGEPGWRIEWGPSRRAYLGSHELRLRGETSLDLQSHAVLMPRALMATLERELFSRITDGVQTRLDDDTPEEMRWLAMSTKLSPAQMGDLHAAYAAVSNAPEWMAPWLGGRLRPLLLAHTAEASGGLAVAPVFVLIAQRGGLAMRMASDAPDAQTLDAALPLFELALAETRRVAAVPLA